MNSIDKQIQDAKLNKVLMNSFIDEYKPFIAKTVSEHLNRYVEYGVDDELTIGMMAFLESVNKFEEGNNFFSFSKRIIKFRLIDYYRKKSRTKEQVVTDDHITDLSSLISLNNYFESMTNELRKYEIEDFIQKLLAYDISLETLVKKTPKSKKLKGQYMDIAKKVSENSELVDKVNNLKTLPIKEILEFSSLNRKKIERGRIYILSMIVIYIGDFNYIRDYISGVI